MEKFTQYRDRGTGVPAFFPPSDAPTTFSSRIGALITVLYRLPHLIVYLIFHFIFTTILPASATRLFYSLLLRIIGIPSATVQLEGVPQNATARATSDPSKYPHTGSIIACTLTSPLEPFYLAANFAPIYTISYPTHRKVLPVTLGQLLSHVLSAPALKPTNPSALVTISELQALHPTRIIAVFPECTASNGRGILPLSPSLVSALPDSSIFPVTLRYLPATLATPLPSSLASFFWTALKEWRVEMRLRVAEVVTLKTQGQGKKSEEVLAADEKKVISDVAEGMARMARVPRVGLTMQQKEAFIKAWNSRSK